MWTVNVLWTFWWNFFAFSAQEWAATAVLLAKALYKITRSCLIAYYNESIVSKGRPNGVRWTTEASRRNSKLLWTEIYEDNSAKYLSLLVRIKLMYRYFKARKQHKISKLLHKNLELRRVKIWRVIFEPLFQRFTIVITRVCTYVDISHCEN